MNDDRTRSNPIATISSGLRTVGVIETENGFRIQEDFSETTETVTLVEWQRLPHLRAEPGQTFGEIIAALRNYKSNLTE